MKKRLLQLATHIERHPDDYQAVIAFFKLRSKEFDYEAEQRKHMRLKKIAEYKRMLDGQDM